MATLNSTDRHVKAVADAIRDYFPTVARSARDVRDPLPADEYLWKLDHKLAGRHYRFTREDLDELEDSMGDIYRHYPPQRDFPQGRDYPQDVKDAIMMLFIILIVEPNARDEAFSIVFEEKTKKSAAPGHGPANTVRKLLGITPRGGSRRVGKKRNKTRSRSRNVGTK
jgi:hypothetical protein